MVAAHKSSPTQTTRTCLCNRPGNVVALDASKPLIDAATKMAKDGMLVVKCPSTRGSSQAQEVSLDADANPERVTFRQCDPMCLPAGLAGESSVSYIFHLDRFSLHCGFRTAHVWSATRFGFMRTVPGMRLFPQIPSVGRLFRTPTRSRKCCTPCM